MVDYIHKVLSLEIFYVAHASSSVALKILQVCLRVG